MSSDNALLRECGEEASGLGALDQSRRGSFDQAINELASIAPVFTGEQFVPGSGVAIAYEHYARYAFALQFVRPESVVIDLGCGVGYGSLLLATRAKRVFALDRSPECLAALRETVARTGTENLTCIEADLEHLLKVPALSEQRIDVVVCHEFIEHINEPLQRFLCEAIGSGKAPFHKETLFLVSTPERHQYSITRSQPNEFHERELTREQFSELISSNFKQARFFWQGAASANCIFPVTQALSPGGTEATSVAATGAATEMPSDTATVSYVKWLDSLQLRGSLTATAPDLGVFLYAVASNGPVPEAPRQLLLLDTSERAVLERMSIAAKELRSLAVQLNEVTAHNRRLQQTQAGSELERGFSAVIDQQAAKIQTLLKANEQLSAEVGSARVILQKLGAVGGNPEVGLQELLSWRELGRAALGKDLTLGGDRANYLIACEKALQAPAHRLISVIGRRFGAFWPVRKLRTALQVASALRKA